MTDTLEQRDSVRSRGSNTGRMKWVDHTSLSESLYNHNYWIYV